MAGAGAATAIISIPLSIGAAERRIAARQKALKGEALLREKEAQEILRRTRIQGDMFKRKSKVVLGDKASKFAKAGVQLSGSALLVLAGSRQQLDREAAELERKGLREAQLMREGAARLRRQVKTVGEIGALEGAALAVGGIGDVGTEVVKAEEGRT